MKILILGFGKTGRDIYSYLEKEGHDLYVYDEKEIREVKYYSYNRLKKELPFFDLIIRSPGISSKSKIYALAKQLTFIFLSEIDFFSEKLKNNIVIGITGSNGKTTLATMLYHILKDKYRTHLLGNIGNTLSSNINQIKQNDIVILELSSFMLEDISRLRLDYGVIVNLSSNHLDKVINKFYYYASKLKIGRISKKLFIDRKIKKFYVNRDYIIIDKIKSPKELNLNTYNEKHFKVAYSIGKELGLSDEEIITNMKDYCIPHYRNELVRKVNNLTFINDSKSTSLDSLKACLSIYNDMKRIIIIGGINKSGRFKKEIFKEDDIILLFGRDKYKIFKNIGGLYFNSLKDIFSYLKMVNDTRYVIFSPACSSLDEYSSFEERGNEFNKLIDII